MLDKQSLYLKQVIGSAYLMVDFIYMGFLLARNACL